MSTARRTPPPLPKAVSGWGAAGPGGVAVRPQSALGSAPRGRQVCVPLHAGVAVNTAKSTPQSGLGRVVIVPVRHRAGCGFGRAAGHQGDPLSGAVAAPAYWLRRGAAPQLGGR